MKIKRVGWIKIEIGEDTMFGLTKDGIWFTHFGDVWSCDIAFMIMKKKKDEHW